MSLEDCHTLAPFAQQNESVSGGDAPLEEIELNISCLLRPGTAVVFLLGSPDGRLQSPLRSRCYTAGNKNNGNADQDVPAAAVNGEDENEDETAWENNEAELHGAKATAPEPLLSMGTLSRVVGALWGAAKRLGEYPWATPAALERFFFQRHLRISFDARDGSARTRANTPWPEADVPRSRLFSAAAIDRMRVTSFSPSLQFVRASGGADTPSAAAQRVVCDYTVVLGVHRGGGVASGGARLAKSAIASITAFVKRNSNSNNNDAASAAAAASSFFTSSSSGSYGDEGLYAVEELGPYRASGLGLPSFISMWLGRRALAATESLVLNEEPKKKQEENANEYEDEEEDNNSPSGGGGGGGVPREEFVFDAALPVASPVCLRMAAADDDGVALHLTEHKAFDMFWLRLILLLCLVRFLVPYVEESAVLQILVAGFGGVVVVCGLGALLVLRQLQDMTVGKVGFIALLAIGGASAVAESVWSAAQTILQVYWRERSDMLQIGMVCLMAVGVFSGIVVRCCWPNQLATLTKMTLRGGQWALWAAAALQNREATLLCTVAAVLFNPARVFRFILWCSGAENVENRENDPQDAFPRNARREVPYTQPICMEGRVGARGLSAADKLRLYDARGDEYTRRALSRLAEKVQRDPERLTARLNNPQRVASWARSFKP